MNVRFIVKGAGVVEKAFGVAHMTADIKIAAVVRTYGELLKTKIQGNASGRPGPRTVTGDYRRSWTVERGRFGTAEAAIVGTNAPQGRRLEYGFVGRDSFGRMYHQPPFPHVRPAEAEIQLPFAEAVGKIADAV